MKVVAMKPKLIKVPAAQANNTNDGILIKVNDGFFVLVENEKKPVTELLRIAERQAEAEDKYRSEPVYLHDHRTGSLPRWTIISTSNNGVLLAYDHVQSPSPNKAVKMSSLPVPLFALTGVCNPVWTKGKIMDNMDLGTAQWYTLIYKPVTGREPHKTVQARSVADAMYQRDEFDEVIFVFKGRPKILWCKKNFSIR